MLCQAAVELGANDEVAQRVGGLLAEHVALEAGAGGSVTVLEQGSVVLSL